MSIAEARATESAQSFLVGLIGMGIAHSLSGLLHEREADQIGLRYQYRTIDLARLGLPATAATKVLNSGRDLGFSAFNITHPCKQLVMPFLDELSPETALLGAVNTVLIVGGRFVGHNTDHSGFTRGLMNSLPRVKLGTVVQIGAGAAGTAGERTGCG